ncbi:MAG: hypothetical protein QOC82_759 [Frankiaceae bacterium]|jgi:hypothetical protein|nr:hypothetical protein [Frankiaceae bacterium]
MYDIGADQITLPAGGRPEPSGTAHAVDRDGEVLCREERPRYHFPWLDWITDSERAAACPACTTIALERALPAAAADDPYPTGIPAVGVSLLPEQPAIDWLRFPQDLSLWSADL